MVCRSITAWSPNGTWIAFAAIDANGKSEGLFLRNPDGVNRLQLSAAPDRNPVWSPDGTTLMWSAGGTWGALECSAGDASASRLPRSEVEPFYVAVSPDGRWLTYENRYRQVQVRPRGNEQLCVGTDGKARIVRRVAEVTVRSTPITFVDGVRVDGAFFMQSVNPDDIDNIEVIKGKAAVGLYGQAASEGVILIRLKQGRQRR